MARATPELRGPVRDVLERFGCNHGKRKRNHPGQPMRSTAVFGCARPPGPSALEMICTPSGPARRKTEIDALRRILQLRTSVRRVSCDSSTGTM